jgi:predicted transcriptional regulator
VKNGTIMSTIELKAELVDLIKKINNKKLLNAVYVLLTQRSITIQEADFWDELPDEVKKDIEEALKEADEGKFFSHQEVMNEIQEKYKIRL